MAKISRAADLRLNAEIGRVSKHRLHTHREMQGDGLVLSYLWRAGYREIEGMYPRLVEPPLTADEVADGYRHYPLVTKQSRLMAWLHANGYEQ